MQLRNMKILLDECIDRRFAREIIAHEVKTVPQMGWDGQELKMVSCWLLR